MTARVSVQEARERLRGLVEAQGLDSDLRRRLLAILGLLGEPQGTTDADRLYNILVNAGFHPVHVPGGVMLGATRGRERVYIIGRLGRWTFSSSQTLYATALSLKSLLRRPIEFAGIRGTVANHLELDIPPELLR